MYVDNQPPESHANVDKDEVSDLTDYRNELIEARRSKD